VTDGLTNLDSKHRGKARAGMGGGAANELGSSHRAGLAAFLASAALSDNSVVEGLSKVPTKIDLETSEATDDLRVTMSDGAVWYVQAKYRGQIGKALDDTARQWARQQIRTKDELVMASARFSTPLSESQAVLDHERLGRGAAPNAAAHTNLETVLTRISKAGTGLDLVARAHARFFRCDTIDGGAERALAAARLDAIVGVGNGGIAFNALVLRFQAAAVRQESTSIDDWVEALAQAGTPITASMSGSGGQARAAHLRTVSEYRHWLATRADRLDLATVAPGLGTIHIPNLIDTWNLERPSLKDRKAENSSELWAVCRRQKRVLVEGLPGMGKSTMVDQLAAMWASDPDAPLPMVVRLASLAAEINRSEDVTITLLATLASARFPLGDGTQIREALISEFHGGRVAFLIDGLDESFSKLGIVLSGITDLIQLSPSQVGWVLTSRPDAARLVDVETLGMERTVLQQRGQHRTAVLAIANEESRLQLVPDQDRSQWIKDRTKWHLDGDSDPLLETPMIVMLIAAYCARHGAPPHSVVGLLPSVLQDRADARTVHAAAAPAGGWSVHIADPMTLDVLVAIGHAMRAAEQITIDEATTAAITAMAEWQLSKPIVSNIAKQLIWYWDERAAVLSVTGGVVTARSRRWIDVADALWVSRRPDETVCEWVDARLSSPGELDAFPPALAIDARVLGELVRAVHAADTRVSQAASVLAEWVDHGHLDSKHHVEVFNAFVRAIPHLPVTIEGASVREKLRARAGLRSEVTLLAISLPLPPGLRSERDELISSSEEGGTRLDILRAIAAISDSVASEALKLPAEATRIMDSIELEAPDSNPMVRDPRTGVYRLAQRSRPPKTIAALCRQIVESGFGLSKHQADWLFRAAHSGPTFEYGRIVSTLEKRGFENTAPLFDKDFFGRVQRMIAPFQDMRWLLDPLAALTTTTKKPDWQLESVSALLVALISFEPQFNPDLRSGQPDDIRSWMAIMAKALSIDEAQLAADAQFALQLDMSPARRCALLLCKTVTTRPISLANFDDDDWITVEHLLSSDNEWVSDTALDFLLRSHRLVPYPYEDVLERRDPLNVAFNRTVLSIWSAKDPIAEALALSRRARPAVRTAAAQAMRAMELGETADEATDQFRNDSDWSVRVAAGASQEQAEGASEWSCPQCEHRNPGVEAVPCVNCGQNSRPDSHREPKPDN